MDGQTCGDCRHFVPSELPVGQPVVVGQPRQGECREGPPNVTVVIVNGQVAGKITSYPAPHNQWAACSRFELAVLTNGNGKPGPCPGSAGRVG